MGVSLTDYEKIGFINFRIGAFRSQSASECGHFRYHGLTERLAIRHPLLIDQSLSLWTTAIGKGDGVPMALCQHMKILIMRSESASAAPR